MTPLLVLFIHAFQGNSHQYLEKLPQFTTNVKNFAVTIC